MKKSSLILMVIILGFLFVPSVLGGAIGDAWDGILRVGGLSFLGLDSGGNFVAFVRIAIAVLIFSLLFMGLSLVPGMKEQRNITITIAIILAIITAVFLPSSLLLAFGGTYATIFALLIIGAPLVGVGWLLFRTPTPNRGVAALKFLGVIFMIWLINEISHWAVKASGGAVTMLVDFSDFVEQFAGWANIVLVIVLIYFGWKFIAPSKVGEKIKELPEKGVLEGMKQFGRGVKRSVVGAEKSLIADYVAEKKELKSLEGLQEDIKAGTGVIQIRGKIEETKKLLNRRLNRFTRRMERYTKRLIKAGKKIKGFDEEKLDVLRKEVLEKHKKIDGYLDRMIKATTTSAMKLFLKKALEEEQGIIGDLRGLLALEKELLKE